ncbi:MAG: molybdopterin cofactor-binding domain-containing protein [Acidobacteriota bacterium]
MSRLGTVTRRTFLIGSAAVAGGVAFGTYLAKRPLGNPLLDGLAAGESAITPYVKIDGEGVTLITPRADKGQGAYSIQAHLIAEELDVDPHAVRLSPGLPGPAYYNANLLKEGAPFPQYDESWVAERMRGLMELPAKLMGMQMTGGSTTTPEGYEKLRMAGAVARETLKEAAAQGLGVKRAELSTRDGHVVTAAGERIAYADLASEASTVRPVADVALRPTSEWRRLGKPVRRTDTVAKATGTLEYGIDLAFDDMLYASVRANPGMGAGVSSFDASAAEGLRGVQKIVPLRHGVAVVADNTWRAFKALDAIEIDWEDGPYPADQDGIWDELASAHDAAEDSRNKDEGDVESALGDSGATVLEAEYRVPFLAHAPLEPMNAVVHLQDERLEIWTGSQIPGFIQTHAAELTGLAPEQIFVYVQPMGGSFGRRLEDTYVLQAIEIAQAVPGRPIKMTWSREEDMTHDFPRPAQLARMRGAVKDGAVTAYDFANSSSSVMNSWFGRLMGPLPGPDATIVSGAWDQPLAIPNYRVTGYRAPEMVPTSSWRSVGNSGVGFQHGGFLDELFVEADLDPMDELIRLCSHDLSRKVLEELKEISAWTGRDLGEGRGRGVAFAMSFGVPMAEVVEVTDTPRGIRIDKVFAVCEVGKVLDPVNIEAQITGGVVWGLGHAMNCELTYENFAPRQTNFHRFEGMRLYQTPEIVAKALENGEHVKGIGEPSVPPAAPALANAIFSATGQRIRELPLNKHIRFA